MPGDDFQRFRKGVSRCDREWTEREPRSLLCGSLRFLVWFSAASKDTVLEQYSCREAYSFKITIPSPSSLILKHPSIFSLSLCICVKFHMTPYIPSLVRCGSIYPWKGSIIIPLVVLIIKKILERQQVCRAWRHKFSFSSWAQRTAENQKVGKWQREDWSHGDKFYQLYSSV